MSGKCLGDIQDWRDIKKKKLRSYNHHDSSQIFI